jgi:chromosome segregation ATPase
LTIIFGAQAGAVVLIDDFRVPDDPDYGWDDYGPGQQLNATQFIDILPETAAIYFLSLRAREESGARRGCCVGAQNSSAAIDSCSLLGRWSLSDALATVAAAEAGALTDLAEQEREPADPSEARVCGTDTVQALRTKNAKIDLDRAYRLNDIKRLTEPVASLRDEVGLLREDRVLQLQDNEALSNQDLMLQREVKALESDRTAQLRDNDTLTTQLSYLQKEMKLLTSDRLAPLRDNESLIARLADLQTEVELLRSERVLQLRDNGRLTAQVTQTLLASKRQRAEHLASLDSLNPENKEFLREIQRLKTTCEADQDRISRLTTALLRLQTEVEFRNVVR